MIRTLIILLLLWPLASGAQTQATTQARAAAAALEAAAVLLDKADGSLELYQDESFEVEGAADLRKKVVVHGSAEIDKFYAKLVVTQKDGKVLHQDFDIGQPMADLNEQQAKLEKKFRALATPLIGAEKADSMVAAIAGLEQQAAVGGLLADGRIG